MAIEVPDGWNELEINEDDVQIQRAFQRSRDGLVLTIERGTVHHYKYAAAFLPENFRQDNQVIRRYGDQGYLEKSDHIEEVESEVQKWMENNKE